MAWEDFKGWGFFYPEVIKSWERDLPNLVTYLRYLEEIRKYIHTTNSLERFIKEVKRRTWLPSKLLLILEVVLVGLGARRKEHIEASFGGDPKVKRVVVLNIRERLESIPQKR